MTKKIGGLNRGFKGVENNSLSEEQTEVLNYLTKDYLTPSKIANIRNTSVQAVYKTIAKLKKKGLIKGVEKGGLIKGGCYSVTTSELNKLYRLHGLAFEIGILKGSELYRRVMSRRNKDKLDNNTLMLEHNTITIYYNKDFWGDYPDECLKLSLAYTERFIVMLENTYKIVLQDASKCNIRQFRGHIAKVGDPYAKKINLDNDKLKIYDDLGRLRLLVDKSFNFDELEAVEKDNHIKDANKINDKWLDLLTSDIKLSEVEKHLTQMQQYQIQNEEFKNEILLMLKGIIIRLDKK
jgi:hypothetical protein